MKILVNIHNKAVFDTFFTEENIALANSLGEVIWNDTGDFYKDEGLAELLKDCDVYVTAWGSPALEKKYIEGAPKLKLLCHLCGTVVPFVTDEMWDKGIRVICGNDYFAESVAEGTVAYMLSALRKIPDYMYRLKNDRVWKKEGDWNESLIYKTVGIVSYGAIAKHLVKLLKPFNVKLKVYDIVDIPEKDKEEYGITQCSLEEVFSTSDVISVHTPYNDHTHHLINDRLFSLIQKDALFVNTSRGKVVDQQALINHVTKGDFNAFLDVLETEPVEPDSPLLECDNVKLMPHMAGPTLNLRKVITRDLLLECKDFIDNGIDLKQKDEITRERAVAMSRS